MSITTFFVGFIFLGGSLLGAASGDCGDPPVPTHGSIATSPATNTTGSEATVACNSGYTMVGTTNISCQSNDTWSSPGTCTDITQVLGFGVTGTPFTGDDVNKTTNLTLAENFVENATITTLTIVDFVPTLWTIDPARDLLAVVDGAVSLVTGKSFDYETSPVLQYVVTATLSSDPVVTATVTLILVLTNANDAPVFDPATYTVEIAKGSEEGTKLVTVSATDADDDSITYSLTSGDDDSDFSINGTTGEMYVAVNGTIEEDSYRLVVMATDNGTLPMSSLITITISVTYDSGGVSVVGVSVIALFGLLFCQLL